MDFMVCSCRDVGQSGGAIDLLSLRLSGSLSCLTFGFCLWRGISVTGLVAEPAGCWRRSLRIERMLGSPANQALHLSGAAIPVCESYGLTEEEIAIVEEAAK